MRLTALDCLFWAIDVSEGNTHTVRAFDWICDLGIKSILEEKYCQPVWIKNNGKSEHWRNSEGKSARCEKWHVYRPKHTYNPRIILEGKLYRGSFGTSAEFSSMICCIKNPDNNERSGMIDWHEKPGSEFHGLFLCECIGEPNLTVNAGFSLSDFIKMHDVKWIFY